MIMMQPAFQKKMEMCWLHLSLLAAESRPLDSVRLKRLAMLTLHLLISADSCIYLSLFTSISPAHPFI